MIVGLRFLYRELGTLPYRCLRGRRSSTLKVFLLLQFLDLYSPITLFGLLLFLGLGTTKYMSINDMTWTYQHSI